jgi:hypothetical protein
VEGGRFLRRDEIGEGRGVDEKEGRRKGGRREEEGRWRERKEGRRKGRRREEEGRRKRGRREEEGRREGLNL